MVAHIFDPIFTLKITVLACFIQKKQNKKQIKNKTWGPGPTRASPPPTYSLPSIPPAEKIRCAHVFSGLSPDMS